MQMSSKKGPLLIHLDINKTILAVDEVKGYKREEILYLEQWKNETSFLDWAHKTYGNTQVEKEKWIKNLKESENEPNLIKYAKEYCSKHKDLTANMQTLLKNVRDDDSTESFWELLKYLKSEEGLKDRGDRECLLVFRSFGSEIMRMFDRLRKSGYTDSILKNADGGNKLFTIVHEMNDVYKEKQTEEMKKKDFVNDKYIQPGNPVPGPKEKELPEFKTRTKNFENIAEDEFKKKLYLKPFICDAVPKFDKKGDPKPFTALREQDLHPIQDLNALLLDSAARLFGTEKFLICGIQDNYKPWSRKNWRNGKPVVIEPQITQLFFDDYSFTKREEDGTYIQALYDTTGTLIDGDKKSLQAKYSAEPGHGAKEGNLPTIFTVVLNKKGSTDTAVMNSQYFISRVRQVLVPLQPSHGPDANWEEMFKLLKDWSVDKKSGEESAKSRDGYTHLGPKFLQYEQDMKPRPIAKPPNIQVDCKILGLYEIDAINQTFQVRFDVVFQWIDPSIPASAGGVYPENQDPNFEDHFYPDMIVMDSQTDSLTLEKPKLLNRTTGEVSRKGHFNGNISQVYNMREFPFDIQYLNIYFTAKPVWETPADASGEQAGHASDEVVAEFQHPKLQNYTQHDDRLLVKRPHFPDPNMDKLTEWDIFKVQGKPVVTDTQAITKQYDGFCVTAIVGREWKNAALNLASLLFFNVLLASTAYALPFDDFEGRMNITLTLFLSAMAFKYVANSNLPAVSYLTFMDTYILLGFFLLFAESMGFWLVFRASGDADTEYTYVVDGTIVGELVRGEPLDGGDIRRPVEGATLWVLDLSWTEDTITTIDNILFTIFLGLWLCYSFYFFIKAMFMDFVVRKVLEDPDGELWSKTDAQEDFSEFSANKINKKGQNNFKNLTKKQKGAWLKFLEYDRTPSVLQIDCRSTDGTMALYNFDGAIHCSDGPDLLSHFDKFVALQASSGPGWAGWLYGWAKRPWLGCLRQIFLNKTSSQKVYEDKKHLGIKVIHDKWGHEQSLEKSLKKVMEHCKPDAVVATVSSNPNGTAFAIENEQALAQKFFKSMDIAVEVVSAKDKGRMEAEAVVHAAGRTLVPAPGLVLNLRGRHARITSTKNKKTYVVSLGWKNLKEELVRLVERKESPSKIDQRVKDFEKRLKMKVLTKAKAELAQQALLGIVGIDGSCDCWKEMEKEFETDEALKGAETYAKSAQLVYEKFEAMAKKAMKKIVNDHSSIRSDDTSQSSLSPRQSSLSPRQLIPLSKKMSNVCEMYAKCHLHQLIFKEMGLHKIKEKIVTFRQEWQFFGPKKFLTNWSSGWYLNKLLSKEVETKAPSIFLYDSRGQETDLYNLSLKPNKGTVVLGGVPQPAVVISKTKPFSFGVQEERELISWRERLAQPKKAYICNKKLYSNQRLFVDEIVEHLTLGIDVIALANTAEIRLGKNLLHTESTNVKDHAKDAEKKLDTEIKRIDFNGNGYQALHASNCRKNYARYEALAVRHALLKSGLPLPSAVCSAVGDYVLIVKFPDRTDIPMMEWTVAEISLPSNDEHLDVQDVESAPVGPEGIKLALRSEYTNNPMFNEEAETVTKAMRDLKKENGILNNLRGLVVTVGDFCKRVDYLSVDDDSTVNDGNPLGIIQTNNVPIFNPDDAFFEVCPLQDTITNKGSRLSIHSPRSNAENFSPEVRLQKLVTRQSSLAMDGTRGLNVRKFFEYARSLVVRDMFEKSDTPSTEFERSKFDVTPPNAFMFSKEWRFENEFENFPTNWVSGWYLQNLKIGGLLYDSATCLIFDCGKKEVKPILCTFSDGRVSSTELSSHAALEEYVSEKGGHTKEQMKREIISQALEVGASIVVIGTNLWHISNERIRKDTNDFLEEVRGELKKTNVHLVLNLPPRKNSMQPKAANPNPLQLCLTPIDPLLEAEFETTATLYAAERNELKDVSAIFAVSTSDASVSLVKNQTWYGRVGGNLGSAEGEKILTNAEDAEKGLIEWQEKIKLELAKWKLKTKTLSVPRMKQTKNETDQVEIPSDVETKNETDGKLVVGIASAYYAFQGTGKQKDFKDDNLPKFSYDDVLTTLKEKLDKCMEDRTGDWKKEVANVALVRALMEHSFHKNSTFVFQREWRVQKSPFRTTWSTGWFIEYLRSQQILRSGRVALVVCMRAETTECFLRREVEKDEIPVYSAILDQSMMTHGKFQRINDYDKQDTMETKLVAKIRSIQKHVAADSVIIELENNGEKSYFNSFKRVESNDVSEQGNDVFTRLNYLVCKVPKESDRSSFSHLSFYP